MAFWNVKNQFKFFVQRKTGLPGEKKEKHSNQGWDMTHSKLKSCLQALLLVLAWFYGPHRFCLEIIRLERSTEQKIGTRRGSSPPDVFFSSLLVHTANSLVVGRRHVYPSHIAPCTLLSQALMTPGKPLCHPSNLDWFGLPLQFTFISFMALFFFFSGDQEGLVTERRICSLKTRKRYWMKELLKRICMDSGFSSWFHCYV